MSYSLNARNVLRTFSILILTIFLCNQVSFVSGNDMYSLETKYLEVPLDHFSAYANPKTFKLRYLITPKNYIKDGPIFAFMGGSGDIGIYAQNTGFILEMAPTFNALVVYIEHRYYGQSLPFGNGSFSSLENIKFLTTTQALADYAFVIDNLKKTFIDPNNQDNYPIIAFGTSYGGILAAWMRMKYPYLVLGSISSSTPIFYFPGMSNCDSVHDKVTQVFKKFGTDKCINTIKLGWDVIINLSKTKLGMDFVSSTWKLCKKLKNTDDLELLLDWLSRIYIKLAQHNYNYPTDFNEALPAYPVKVFCDKVTTSTFNDTKGFVEYFGAALDIYTNYTGTKICNNYHSKNENFEDFAWDYQSCTEIIRPTCSLESDIFITKPWDYKNFANECYKKFGVNGVRPNWALLTYGGRNFNFYSNMLFTNDMMDPYVDSNFFLNTSNTVQYINITDAPYMLDFRASDHADNNYVLEARRKIQQTIGSWLETV